MIHRFPNAVFSLNERNEPNLENDLAERVEPAIIKSNSDKPDLDHPIARAWLRIDRLEARCT